MLLVVPLFYCYQYIIVQGLFPPLVYTFVSIEFVGAVAAVGGFCLSLEFGWKRLVM